MGVRFLVIDAATQTSMWMNGNGVASAAGVSLFKHIEKYGKFDINQLYKDNLDRIFKAYQNSDYIKSDAEALETAQAFIKMCSLNVPVTPKMLKNLSIYAFNPDFKGFADTMLDVEYIYVVNHKDIYVKGVLNNREHKSDINYNRKRDFENDKWMQYRQLIKDNNKLYFKDTDGKLRQVLI